MIIYRQLCKEIFIATVMVFLVIAAIISTGAFSILLDSVAKGELTLSVVMKLMSLQFLIWLCYLLPQCFYFALLMVLTRWYKDQEMTVLFACGMSYRKLLSMILSLAVAMMLISFWLVCYIDPLAEGAEHVVKHQAMAEFSLYKFTPNQFIAMDSDKVLYAVKVDRDKGTLHGGVLTFKNKGLDKSGNARWDVVDASSASQGYHGNNVSPFIVYHHGALYQVTDGEQGASRTQFVDMGFRLPEPTRVFLAWPKGATLTQLWKAPSGDLNAQAMLQWRLSLPVSILILALWAFSLSYVKPRQRKTWVIISAVVLYLVYSDLLYMMRSWIALGKVSPFVGMWSVHLGALFVAIFLWGKAFGIGKWYFNKGRT